MPDFSQKQFRDADQKLVTYDGSPVTWRVSAYVLIRQEDQLLLCKSKREELYDAIGGGVELGETIEEALHREAMEEAGARITIGKLLHAHTDWFYHRNGTFYQSLLLFYQAVLQGELQKPTDPHMQAAQFVPLSQMGKTYAVPPIVLTVVEQFL